MEGFPTTIVSDREFLGEMAQLLPGWVKGAHVALDLRSLIKCERDLTDARRQASRTPAAAASPPPPGSLSLPSVLARPSGRW